MTQVLHIVPNSTNGVSTTQGQQQKKVKCCQSCKTSEKELLRCSQCKSVYYCSVQCQKLDWPVHKPLCQKPVQQSSIPSKTEKPKAQKQEGLNEFNKLVYVGSGNFSTIFKTTSKKDGKMYAIKQIEKDKVTKLRKQGDVFMEKHCLMKLRECNYVVKLFKTFQDGISLYLQMEYPEKGQLWEISKMFGIIPNSLYKYYVSHIIKAVSLLHNKYQIVHRDLKPQNILLDSENRIKLIDFGTAKDLERPDIVGSGNGVRGKKQFQHYVGTANYMAPQCIHNKASQKKSDIYSLSGVLYFLKVGSPPFQGGSQYLTFTKSLQTQLFLCSELFGQQLKELISRMNCKEMNDRIDINEAIKDKYFSGVDFESLGSFEEALANISEDEKYLLGLTDKLGKMMTSEKQPKIEKRKEIYVQQVRPILQEQQKLKQQNKELLRKLWIIDIQCQSFLNIRDNNDVSFTEIYKQVQEKQNKSKS